MVELRDEMREARMRLLGAFSLNAPDGERVIVSSRRGRAMLAHLYLTHDQAAGRGQLCGLFWSDRGEAQARASLRQCVLTLRQELSQWGVNCIDAGRERIALRGATLASDVEDLRTTLNSDDFPATVAAVRRIGRSRLLEDLELPGLFGDWLVQSRSEFDESLASRVKSLLRDLEASGRWSDVRTLADAYLARDPLDELVSASAIRGDIALGAQANASRRFQTLKSALLREFGAAPGAAVTAAITPVSSTRPSRVTLTASTESNEGRPLGGSPPEHRSDARASVLGGGRPTVAILSFSLTPGAEAQAYLAQGIAEDIAIALGKFKWLFVLSPRSSLAYESDDADLRKVRSDLGVRYIVHGKLRLGAGRLRLNVCLSDCMLGDAVWADRFEGPIADVFAMTDDIVASVVGSLEPALIRREENAVRETESRTLELWDLFIHGRWHFWRLTYRHVAEAQTLLNRAVSIAPSDAQILSLLAFTHIIQLWSGWSQRPNDTLKEASTLASRAVRVGADDAFAHYTLGTALSLTGELDRAMSEQRTALDINPNLAGAMGELGRYHAFSGDYALAIDLFDRAIRTSPNDSQLFLWLRHKAVAAFAVERLDEAVTWARAAVTSRPDVSFNHYLLASVLAARGSVAEARETFAEARRLLPNYPMAILKFSNPFQRPPDMARYVDALISCGWEDR